MTARRHEPSARADLAGVEAALRRARRRAMERRFGVLLRRRDRELDQALAQSIENLVWLVDRLEDLEIPDLLHDKRVQLATGSQRLAIEHGQAIVALIDRGLDSSALALLRPMLEAHIGGTWLCRAATDVQVDDAGEGRFPPLQNMAASLPMDCLPGGWRKPLHDYACGSVSQIGAESSPAELEPDGARDKASMVLQWSDAVQLAVAIELALIAGNESLAKEFLDRTRHIGPPPTS